MWRRSSLTVFPRVCRDVATFVNLRPMIGGFSVKSFVVQMKDGLSLRCVLQ